MQVLLRFAVCCIVIVHRISCLRRVSGAAPFAFFSSLVTDWVTLPLLVLHSSLCGLCSFNQSHHEEMYIGCVWCKWDCQLTFTSCFHLNNQSTLKEWCESADGILWVSFLPSQCAFGLGFETAFWPATISWNVLATASECCLFACLAGAFSFSVCSMCFEACTTEHGLGSHSCCHH